MGISYETQTRTQKTLTMVENTDFDNTSWGEDSQCLNGSEGIEYIGKVATESVIIQIPKENRNQM